MELLRRKKEKKSLEAETYVAAGPKGVTAWPSCRESSLAAKCTALKAELNDPLYSQRQEKAASERKLNNFTG
ncbi:hypothetical protein K0M31_010121 [Melipona bicolor]|uniref:Uncharacterized protein n=1 Tax=Melipona bicolor TaxID=60889 RepID=A0AA40KIP4_9HYME|nr:hypothetical protein K0M31_010121 [Melipona bicolor]